MATIDINEVLEQWKDDVILDESKLSKEIMRVPMLHSKYLSYYIHFKQKFASAESKYNKLSYLRKRYYRGELTQQELIDNKWGQYQGLKMSNTEFNQHSDIDPILVDCKRVVDEYKLSVSGCEYILTQLKGREYALKSLIDYQKFIAGN